MNVIFVEPAFPANQVLGIRTSATHVEWFFGPKGLRFSEIGRPSGVGETVRVHVG